MSTITQSLAFRYGGTFETDPLTDSPTEDASILAGMIARGSCRDFTDRRVDPQLIRLLCAAALASPTKSDLQQRDIIIMQDPDSRAKLAALVSTQPWVSQAPNLAVFCGNNRRQRKLHEMRGHGFANHHLDAFFNAVVDAGVALSAFVSAAEALGLGCCPISAVRDDAAAVSDLLGLPDHMFPVAGLAFGYPADPSLKISMRLPLEATVHIDRYSDEGIETTIATYDKRRAAQQPYDTQRATNVFGRTNDYGWSEDKSRQYALPERSSFGAFIRSKGFDLS